MKAFYQLNHNYHGHGVLGCGVYNFVWTGNRNTWGIGPIHRVNISEGRQRQKKATSLGYTFLRRAVRSLLGRITYPGRNPRTLNLIELFLAFGVVLFGGNIRSLSQTFNASFDSLNRLTNATCSDGSRESYLYDDAGNRLSRIRLAATTPADSIPPSVPTNFVSLTFTPDQLSVGWNRSYDTGGSGLVGYRIYTNGVFAAFTTNTNYFLSGLLPDTQYCLSVSAYDRSGNTSAQSPALCFTTATAIATAVNWYFYPCSLPDVTVPEFGTARDNLLTLVVFGGPLVTRSRVNLPTGIEIRPVFDATDMSISTNFLWRGQFNPPAPYATQHGQRIYCPVLLIGRNGKVSLNRLDYRVTCGVALFNNQSSLSGLNYSVSRVGLQAGADKKLFTPDDTIVKSGAGTNLMDAIAFIGGRIGALVNDPSDFDELNAVIGDSGTFINFDYRFVSPTGIVSGGSTLWLYPMGLIPSSFNRIVPFQGPQGFLFSVVGPAGSSPMTLRSARDINGPWTTETVEAVEGTSIFKYFTGSQNDKAFVRLLPNQ